MPHPEVLVEMDLISDTRWYTVKGKHYPFYGATSSLDDSLNVVREDSPPDHHGWGLLNEYGDYYLQTKHRLVPAYPQAPTPAEDRPGLRTESIDWEAHRAFLRSL